MKVKEIIENYGTECVDVEVWKYTGSRKSLHTDCIESVETSDCMDEEADDYYIMDEEEYDRTICTNTDHADFYMWYNNKEAKVLVITLA